MLFFTLPAFQFVGQALMKLVTTRLVRITGVSLNATSGGTIGLFENQNPTPPNIRLPEAFKPRPYDMPDTDPAVTLQDSVQCNYNFLGIGQPPGPLRMFKTGTTPKDFQIALFNGTPDVDSGPLEIYVGYH